MADPGVGGKTILVVDDDKGVLSVAEAVLVRAGYAVIAVTNPLVALRKSREFAGEIHLLLTDVAMPEMDGVQLARQVQAERPQTRVLLMSGYMASATRFPFVSKPFAFNDLLQRVASIMAAPPRHDVSASDDPNVRKPRLDEARRKYLESSREFYNALNQIPAGLQGSDGATWLRNKGKARRQAFAKYRRALEEADRHSTPLDDQDDSGE